MILENFKQINKMLRTNFLTLEGRKGLQQSELRLLKLEDEAVQDMTQVMKKLQQTHNIETKWKIDKKKLSL